MIHVLKTWPDQFQRVVDGVKTAEFRLNDRNFQVGDFLLLIEWDPRTGDYTERKHGVGVFVTDVVYGGEFGIPIGYCMMSITRVNKGQIE